MFFRNVFKGRIDSAFLLGCLPMYVPARIGRQLSLFQVPYARVNTVRNGLFTRAPRLTNVYLRVSPTTDVFCDCFSTFRAGVLSYVSSL